MSYVPSRDETELQARLDGLMRLVGELSDPSLESIVNRVATITGHVIEVDPVGSREWETLTGMTLVDDRHARILIRLSDAAWYQFHTVLHELGHLLFGHSGCASLPVHHPGRRHIRGSELILTRDQLRGEIDFENPMNVQEHEAERLAHLLADLILAPRYTRDDEVFG